MKFAKILVAAALILSFVISACACRYTSNTLEVTDPYAGTQLPPASNTQTEPSSVQQVTDATLPTVEDTTMPIVPESTTAPNPNESTTLPPAENTTAPEPTTEKDPSNWTTQEIVTFLSNAVNKTKAYTGTVTVDRHERFGVTVDSIKPNLPGFQQLANSIIPKIVEPTDETLTFNGGTAVNTDGETIPLLLPKRQAFSLSPAGVKSASAKKQGNDIVINVTLIAETGTKTEKPYYTSNTAGYLNLDDFDMSVVKVETMDVGYPGTTLQITVNRNGYVTAADYNIPITLAASGSALGIPGSFTCTGYQTEAWEIHW